FMYLTNAFRSRTWFIIPGARDALLAVCLGALLLVNAAVASEAVGGAGPAGLLAFDIPSQPLESALEQYGDVTGWEVLYNSNLAAARRSSAVRGTFAPDAALKILLKGTSLTARHTSDVSIMLAPIIVPQATQPQVSPFNRDYYGEIQQSIEN